MICDDNFAAAADDYNDEYDDDDDIDDNGFDAAHGNVGDDED